MGKRGGGKGCGVRRIFFVTEGGGRVAGALKDEGDTPFRMWRVVSGGGASQYAQQGGGTKKKKSEGKVDGNDGMRSHDPKSNPGSEGGGDSHCSDRPITKGIS